MTNLEKDEDYELLCLMLIRMYGFYLFEDELRRIFNDEKFIQTELERTKHLMPGRFEQED